MKFLSQFDDFLVFIDFIQKNKIDIVHLGALQCYCRHSKDSCRSTLFILGKLQKLLPYELTTPCIFLHIIRGK